MEAVRCQDCGDVRWSFLGFASREDQRCELCGGETVPERRHPHGSSLEHLAERRELAADRPVTPAG